MNLFDLFATINLDSSGFEAGLENAQKSTASIGDKIGSALSKIGKVSAAAMGVAAAGVSAITKSAVGSYADYEQLVGGVETLFGTGGKTIEEYAEYVGKTVDEIKDEYYNLYTAQNTVMDNAAEAYKSAGLSANEYMETITSFAASLVASVDGNTQRAASLADAAIRDMSDNANKMGTSMEAIQNAYQGFAKQNYTMLDNLKLGYGGTKTEMERLILDAEKIDDQFKATRDENGELTMSFRDIVVAIGLVQDKMGITGTTAKEAAKTISGSLSSMKSAWKNLITGIASENADMDTLVGSLVDTIETTLDNIIPAVERAFNGIGKAVTKLAPIIGQKLGGLLSNTAPALIESAGTLVMAFADAIMSNADTLIQSGLDLMLMLIQGITENGATISEAIGTIIDSIGIWLMEYGTVLVQGAVDILMLIAQGLIDNIPILAQSLAMIIEELAIAMTNPEMLASLLNAVLLIIQTIASSIMENVPTLVDTTLVVLNNIVTFILDNLPMFLDTAVQLIMALVDGFMQALPAVLAYLPTIIDGITTTLLTMLPLLVDTGVQLLTALIKNLPTIINTIVAAMPEIIDSIVNSLKDMIPTIVETGVRLLTALVDNLPQILQTLVTATPLIIERIVNGLKDLLPMLVQTGVDLFVALIKNLPQAIVLIVQALPDIISAIVGGLGEFLPSLWQAGKDLIAGLWNGINDAKEWLREKISGFFGGVVDSIKAFFGIKSPSKLFAGIGEMLDRGLAKGVGDYADLAVDAAEDMANDVFDATDRDYDFTATGNVDDTAPAWRKNAPVINVYGAEGQDVNELAEIISERMAFTYSQEQAVWA